MATYYVKNSGNDGAAGTSPATAWATMMKVWQAAQVGDTVLLECGSQWREQLFIPKDGLTVSKYGSGNKPVINAADKITAWSTSNIWKAAVPTEPKHVYFDGVRGVRVNSQGECDAPKKWYWAGGVLYTYGTQDPSTVYTSAGVEAGARDWCVLVNGQDGVTLDGLEMCYSNKYAVQLGPDETINAKIQNCVARDSFYSAVIQFGTGTGLTADTNMVMRAGACGISVAGTGNHNVKVTNNTISDGGWNPSADNDAKWNAGIKIFSPSNNSNNAEIAGNVITGQLDQFGDLSGTGIWVDTWGTGSVVHHNVVHNCATHGIMFEFMGAGLAHHNVAYQCKKGIVLFRNVSGSAVYNNTVYGCTVAGLSNEGFGIQTAQINNVFKNNIAVNSVRNLYAINGGSNDQDGHGNVYVFNCLGVEQANFVQWASNLLSTYAALEAAYGGAMNNVKVAPVFVDAANANFWQTAASLTIDAGTPIPGITDGYICRAPDVGRFEFVTGGTNV